MINLNDKYNDWQPMEMRMLYKSLIVENYHYWRSENNKYYVACFISGLQIILQTDCENGSGYVDSGNYSHLVDSFPCPGKIVKEIVKVGRVKGRA